jgi:hypothetical protein
MPLLTVARTVLTTLLAVAPAVAFAEVCAHGADRPSVTNVAGCSHFAESDAVGVPPSADQRNDDFPVATEFPRQTMTVWFPKPVKVGDRILLGTYVIEHDNVRMSRGQPCTHIYAASDPRLPVVAFRCRHLTRPTAHGPTVVVRPLGEANGMTELLAFQFAGESAAHGVPTPR